MYTFHELTNEVIQNNDASRNRTLAVGEHMRQISKLVHFKNSSQDSK